jgi:small subunit ribosomal protein S6
MAENMHDYEMVVIAVPDLDEQGLTSLNDRISNWITSSGGSAPQTNVWGRRRMAFAIKKRTDGIYVQYDFQLDPSASRNLDRNLRIDEQVIRHMIVRKDEE